MRGLAVAAIALTSVLTMAACAKDTGGNNTGTGSTNTAEGCKLADKPPAATATSSSAASGEKVDGSALKVGLAYDIGGRGDASFNDSAAAGLDKAKADFGIAEVKELTAAPNEPEDAKQTRLRQLASEGFNPIIGVGFAYAESLKVVAPEFPAVKFAIVDGAVEGAANVTPLLFAEEQGSFLAGVIAAYKSKACHVGFVGGVEIPLIQKFDAGFAQGAKTAAPDIKIEKKYLTPAGDFTGFQDPAKGQEAATGQVEAGADVLYHAAGASGKGVFSAAKSGNALAIGVDSDQYNQKTVEESKDVIVSSMLKRVDVAVYDFVKAVAQNDLASLPKVFDLSVDGVGYSTSGGKIDDNLKAVLEGYKAQIIEGKIKVESTP
ncbi:BMP family ABC transporter substrate-binding protein [Saccharothrix sp. 6-C]|nr:MULTISPECIES: BMP family ABC transporter substrate-binding protein [Saccharothrix]QQQ80925.1 BMP family ABC transporter substrate-binding protein [Saccharothrix sp. 6-C]